METTLLRNYYRESLTESQSDAVDELEVFLRSEESCFLLTGYAGTGKTYVLSQLSEYLHDSGKTYYFLTPAGRAARVIRKRTQKAAFTIHSRIYEVDNNNITSEETANKHYLYYKQLMDRNEWTIRGDKKTKVDGLPGNQTVNKKNLKSLWEELYMQNAVVYSGSVKKIMNNSGFILYEDQTGTKQIYYSNKDVKGNVILTEGDLVDFCMESSFDRKKNKASSKATHICKK